MPFRANPFHGSKVTDKERLHPLNHARVKDGISSVRFFVRINHSVLKEKQISSVNSGLATEGTSIFVSVPKEMNGCAACMLMRVSRGGVGRLKR